jgi:UPF0755 protein
MAQVNVREIREVRHQKDSSRGFCFSCGLVLLIIFLIGGVIGLLQLQNYNDFSNSKTLNKETVVFEVKEGESIAQIAENLTKQGIIQDKNLLILPARTLYLQLNPVTTIVQPGFHEIPAETPISEVFTHLVLEDCDQITVTFKEGWRIEEFGQQIQKAVDGKEGVKFSYDEFVEKSHNYVQGNGMDLNRTYSGNLEGYLYPDTYNFCSDTMTISFIDKLVSTFDSKVYAKIKDQLSSKNKNLEELIKVASLVERESFNNDIERKTIAGIIESRLNNDMVLGIDATSQYSAGFSASENTWWPRQQTLLNQLQKDEPYNTRKRAGLPPTPISNPGFKAISAALEPIDSDYFYYLHDNDGVIRYGKNLNEHNSNKCRYLGSCG